MKHAKLISQVPTSLSIFKRLRYFNNLMVFFLMFCGIVVIYKYVKSLENELKQLSSKVHNMKTTSTNTMSDVWNEVHDHGLDHDERKQEENENVDSNQKEEEEEEEDESVHSLEILQLLEEIDDVENNNDNENDSTEQKNDQMHADCSKGGLTSEMCTSSAAASDSSFTDIVQNTDNDVPKTEDVNIDNKNPTQDATHIDEQDLFKAKNEELKKILKKQGKSVKGTKTEMIHRILNIDDN
jgi:hypothetical protein